MVKFQKPWVLSVYADIFRKNTNINFFRKLTTHTFRAIIAEKESDQNFSKCEIYAFIQTFSGEIRKWNFPESVRFNVSCSFCGKMGIKPSESVRSKLSFRLFKEKTEWSKFPESVRLNYCLRYLRKNNEIKLSKSLRSKLSCRHLSKKKNNIIFFESFRRKLSGRKMPEKNKIKISESVGSKHSSRRLAKRKKIKFCRN